ncbi:hypothetical protein ABPG74_000714 [Tetrahymena malaccensis]
MNEDSSNLRQRQETMRKAMKQEGVINEIQLYNGINSDDDRILMSFADSLNPNSPQLRFQNDNHFQIENNLQIQKNDENEFDQKYIDLLSPQNRTSLFESEQKLNTLKQQQILQKQNTLIGRRRTTAVQQGEIADKNQLICTQKEISIQSISYESKSGHQNSKQSLKQSDDTQEKNIIKNQDNPQKNHKSVDQNFEQLKQYQENILKVNIPKVKADFMTTLKISKIFINKMKTQVRSILSRNLSLQSFKIIEDRSSNYDVYIKQQQITNIFSSESCLQIQNGKYLFTQDSMMRLLWDTFLTLLTLYLIIFIPFDHVYQREDDQLASIIHDQVVFVIMILEILVNLNSVISPYLFSLHFNQHIFFNQLIIKEIYSNGLAIKDRKIIFVKTLSKNLRDLIMVLLYKISRNYKDSQSDLKYINYVVFFKYLDIPKKLNELETKLHFSESTQNWLKLLKLEIVVVILAHVAACIFLRIGLSEVNQGQDCWITKFQIDDQTIWGQYLVSFYYMIISMVTIGYGDFFPTTQYERGYIIIVALLATNVCAYSFSQISEIVKFEQAKKENFNQGMINLNQKMKLNGISMNLQQKIRKYFEYHHFSLAEKKNETDQFMEQLPFKLRQQFCLETNQKLINSVYIFKILSPKCIEQISSFIKQKYLMPDEILLESNTSNDCLYYINKGFLDIYTNCSEKKNYEKIDLKRNSLGQAIRCQLKEDCQKINQKILQRLNEVFGYEGFLLGEQNQFGLKSNGKTIVSYIDRTSFMQILKQFPDDYEKVMHIRDQTIFDIGVNVKNKLKCVSCSSNEHQYLQCPYVTYTKKYKENQLDIQRQQYKRKKYDKVQVLKTLSYIQEKAMLAYAELNDESLLYDAISYQHMQSLDGKENIDSNSFCSSQSEESEDSENKNTTQLELMTKTISKQLQEGFTQSFNQFLSEESENNKTDSKIKHEQQENTNNQKNMKSSMNHFGFQNVKQSVSEDIQFDSVQNKHNQENSAQRKKKSKTYNQQKTKQSKHNQQLNQKQRNQNNAIFDKKYSKTAEYQDMETDKSSTQHREEQKTLQESVKDSQNRSSEDSSKQNKNSNKLKKDNFLEKVFDRRRKRMTKIIELQNQLKRNRQTQAKQKENNQRVQDEIIQSNESEQILNICKQKQLISQIINQNRQSFSNLQSEKSSSPQIKSFDQIDKLLNFNDLSKQKTNFVSPLLTQSQKSPLIEQEMLKSYAPHEAMIRCQENVQDLDLLIVRKQYQLLQQQNKNNINNYVELPDNEMDIDQLKEYQFYYPKYNCKNILNRVKKIQDTLTKNSKLKDRTSISKKGAQTKKKFDRISNSSVNINGKQVTNRLRLLLVQNAQQN